MKVLKISCCILVVCLLVIAVWYGLALRQVSESVPESIAEPVEVAIDYSTIRIDEPPTEAEEIEVDKAPVEIEPPIEVESVFYLTDEERAIAEKIVMGESGNQPYEGQVLVAQCLLNASLKDGIQPSEVRVKYKYAGWHEEPTESVKQAVSAVFDDGYKVTDEFILYFYAPKYSKGSWHETQCHVITLGGHKFFKEWED